jgi:hypothetical protein
MEGDQLLLGYLVKVMDVYWKSATSSYPESAKTFTRVSPASTEPTPTAQLAKSKVNGWSISWLHKDSQRLVVRALQGDRNRRNSAIHRLQIRRPTHWKLKHGFLALHDLAFDPPTTPSFSVFFLGRLASDADGGIVTEEWCNVRLVFRQKGETFRFEKLAGYFSS